MGTLFLEMIAVNFRMVVLMAKLNEQWYEVIMRAD